MTCKCDLKLENKKFNLNIDLSLYQKLKLINNDTMFPSLTDPSNGSDLFSNPYPDYLFPMNGFENFYHTRKASYTNNQLLKLKNAINNVKNNRFLCNCLKSKINTIKFILIDERDSYSFRSGPPGIAAANPKCNNVIMINAGLNSMLNFSENQIEEIIAHEITHLMEGCRPCRSKNNNDIFDNQINKLYNQFKLIYNDIKNFNNDFTKLLIQSKLITLKNNEKSIINQDFLFKKLEYALTNKDEFLAVFSQFFCYEMPYNNLLITNSYTPNNPIITDANLRSLYISRFNQRYKNLIQQVCELFNKIQSDPNNCNENTAENIEAFLSLKCNSSILQGINLCCNGYDIYLNLSSDSGCCDSNEPSSSSSVKVGQLSLINLCNCGYLFNKFDINLSDLMKLINNCCNAPDLYPIDNKGIEADNFKNSISDQIFNIISNAFGDNIKISKNIICF